MAQSVPADKLRRQYTPEKLEKLIKPLTEHPIKAIIGQDRAIRALKFGLANKAAGFNIFVSGLPGEGLIEAIQHFLRGLAAGEAPPRDWIYVNNFQDPYCPKALSLSTGAALQFKTDIEEFITEARNALIKAFESDEYSTKVDAINKEFQEKEKDVFADLEQRARRENFIIKRTPVEIIALPLIGGRPMTEKEFFGLSQKEQDLLLAKQASFKDDLKTVARKARELDREYNRAIYDLEQRVALFAIETLLEELQETYADQQAILDYLQEVKDDLLDNLAPFLQHEGKDDNSQPTNILQRYEVNVLVDNAELQGAPIVLELNPTYNNLLGKIENESFMGTLVTDFTLIRSGSLHAANGGYIIIPIEDLLRNPFSWESLKRALRNQQIIIEDAGDRLGFMTTKSLRPQPIPLHLQVILIGRPDYYYLLFEYDDDFRDLFKVKADFDNTMEPSQENLRDFIAFFQHLCREEKLLPVSTNALASIIEYAHRLADHQKRISNQFGELSDLVREANHYASQAGAKEIGATHIEMTIQEKIYRSNLLQEKIIEYIDQGVILLDVDQEVVGQVNGLSVLDLGDITFGRPNRITASVSVGRSGILDIERESKLGGPIHTKGVLILSGYLAGVYGQEIPLSLSAQLVFEQSYSGVEGDSASSAELYALLSALADIPIKQSIAVTGSINQKGQIQAVGGINEKIEGFFETCRLKGLTGQQGVLIPAGNLVNLMLKEEVVEAVRQQQFNIWAISNVDEGIELLTGLRAGKITIDEKTGKPLFEKDTLHDRVNRRLKEINQILDKHGKKEEK